MKRCLVVLAVVSLALAAWATEITFWFAGGDPALDLPVVKKQIEEFEKATGIKVKFIAIPWAEHPHDKLQVAIAAGKAPDIAKIGSPFEHVLARYGVVEPLDQLIPAEVQATFIPAILEDCRYKAAVPAGLKGKLVSIPYFTDTRVILYRKDIFAERGVPEPLDWTWDDFVEYAQQLTFDDVYGFGTSGRYNSQFIIFVWQAGGEILDENDYPLFTSPEFLEGINFYWDLYHTYRVVQPGAVNAHLWDVRKMLAEGKIAMYIDCGDSARVLYEELGDKLGAGLLPKHPRTGKRTAFFGADSFVILKQSRHKQEAAKLLLWLIDKDRMIEYCRVSGFLPARADAAADPVFAQDPIKAVFIRQLEDSRGWIKHPEASFIARILRTEVQEALAGNKSVEEALRAVQETVVAHFKEKGYLR